MSDISECPKCKSANFTLTSVYLGEKFMYRVLECKDCHKAAFDKMISELSPTKGMRYAKTKLRTDYYGTVTIKDIIDDKTGLGLLLSHHRGRRVSPHVVRPSPRGSHHRFR